MRMPGRRVRPPLARRGERRRGRARGSGRSGRARGRRSSGRSATRPRLAARGLAHAARFTWRNGRRDLLARIRGGGATMREREEVLLVVYRPGPSFLVLLRSPGEPRLLAPRRGRHRGGRVPGRCRAPRARRGDGADAAGSVRADPARARLPGSGRAGAVGHAPSLLGRGRAGLGAGAERGARRIPLVLGAAGRRAARVPGAGRRASGRGPNARGRSVRVGVDTSPARADARRYRAGRSRAARRAAWPTGAGARAPLVRRAGPRLERPPGCALVPASSLARRAKGLDVLHCTTFRGPLRRGAFRRC